MGEQKCDTCQQHQADHGCDHHLDQIETSTT
jgi:hypothetical protein